MSWSKRPLIERALFADERIGDNTMSSLVLTTYAWGHRAVHGTHTAIKPFYTAMSTGGIPTSSERQDELALSLKAASFVLHMHAHFLDRFFRQGREADVVEIGRRVAD